MLNIGLTNAMFTGIAFSNFLKILPKIEKAQKDE